MLFTESVFKIKEQDAYFTDKMNGLSDPKLKDYQFLSFSPAFKKEYLPDKEEKEYIKSYIEAAKIIAEKSKIDNPAIRFVIKEYSLGLPCIFLCRHAIELSIKRCISKMNTENKHIHSLKELWEYYEKIARKKYDFTTEQELLADMKSFIILINDFDNNNGTKLRYSKGKDGKDSQDKLIFVNLKQITETTDLFVEQMELLS